MDYKGLKGAIRCLPAQPGGMVGRGVGVGGIVGTGVGFTTVRKRKHCEQTVIDILVINRRTIENKHVRWGHRISSQCLFRRLSISFSLILIELVYRNQFTTKVFSTDYYIIAPIIQYNMLQYIRFSQLIN